MNNKQLKIICNHLNLGKPIFPPKKVLGGLLHLMWHIETEKGLFAVKQLSKNIILTEKVRKSYELSEHVASQFSLKGIPLISAIGKNGKFLVDAEGSTFIIYPWINAEILDKNKIDNAHVIKIAKLLAKIHLINLQVAEIESPQYDIHDNEEIISLIEKSVEMSLPFSSILQKYKKMIIKLNDEYQQAVNLFKHDFVISHADLDPKNVLWDGNNPILIDWESVRALNPAYEMLIAALDWSGATTGQLNIELFLSMINEYKESGGKINEDILNKNFYGIPGNGISWLIYNIRRCLKVNDIFPEEKEIGINQVNHVISTMKYIEDKIEYLKTMIKN